MNKLIGVVMLWVTLAMINGVCELNYVGSSEQSVLNTLFTGWRGIEGASFIANAAGFINYLWDWFNALFRLLFFDFAFFQGEWGIIRWVFFIPIAIGIIWMIVSMMRGTSSG